MASTVLGGAALSIAGLKEDIMRKMCLLAAALTVTIASAHPGAHAQFMRQEIHTFQSSEMTEAEFLTGKKGTPVMLAGQLRMPKLVGKQPVVVLLHGAGGIGPSKHIIAAWADVINEAGIGVFIIDSWSGRGLTQISTDITRVSEMSRMNDVLGALVLLEKHPLVDPQKIAVLGSSHGGPAALFLALKQFEKHYKSEVRFAAHISVSGACNTAYRGNEDFVKPVLMLHGSADDWVPAAPCREYADRLAKAGKNVRYIEYADAHHAFSTRRFSRRPLSFRRA